MKIDSFRYKMIDYNFCIFDNNVILFKLKHGKWEVYDEDSTIYDNLQSALVHTCKCGETISQLIEKLEQIEIPIEGGRGASGGQTFGWANASDGGGGDATHTVPDLPARMNNAIKVKTREEAIAEFRKKHGNSDIEHSITIDKNGFVNSYQHGNKNSVMAGRTEKGDWLIHNHPNNSSFSPADMLNTAMTHRGGIVATHSGGYRVFSKGPHFDQVGFVKAVKKAQKTGLKGKDGNAVVDNFLKRNQKKYGYRFENRKD